MAELEFQQAINIGLYKTSTNYLTARNSATSTSVSNAVGQNKSGSDYFIYRYFVGFNTSGLDDVALIQSAYITLTNDGDSSATDFDIIIKNGMPTYPHSPVVTGDYALSNYDGNGGSVNTANTYTVINLNATGLGWVNKTGITKFALISSRDIGTELPVGIEFIQYNTGGGRTTLTVVYFVPSAIPVVGDPTYSPKATYAVATANVTDAGGGYEERGFEYGTSETPTWAVRETGIWGATGNFSLTLPDLLPLTTYYVRAFVTNSYGTGFSDWTSFTTTDVPTYGIYEESNTATICFYVRKIGGKWSIKHGPYTTDQADIKITDILTEGTGKYQIKFESDVLTGLSASIMCKLDVKVRG